MARTGTPTGAPCAPKRAYDTGTLRRSPNGLENSELHAFELPFHMNITRLKHLYCMGASFQHCTFCYMMTLW